MQSLGFELPLPTNGSLPEVGMNGLFGEGTARHTGSAGTSAGPATDTSTTPKITTTATTGYRNDYAYVQRLLINGNTFGPLHNPQTGMDLRQLQQNTANKHTHTELQIMHFMVKSGSCAFKLHCMKGY